MDLSRDAGFHRLRRNDAGVEDETMIVVGSLALLRPLWLLVPPALLLLLRVTRRRDALGDWRKAFDAPLLAAVLRRQPDVGASHGVALIPWTVALLALALSGPAVKSTDATQFRNLDAALILLDVSREDRLSQAVAAAQLVLADGGARQAGLVLFAGDAYLASPLTDDVDALQALLFVVDGQTVPDGGVRPDRALAYARRVLRRTGALAGDVALISDGDGLDARANAEGAALAAEGHALHTLFVAPHGAGDAHAPARRAAMAALATQGHGLAGDAAHAESVVAAIAGRRIEHIAQGARRALEWRDYGRWLLLAAAAPLLLFLRARAS
jgi:Ca-activated chloride channel homolog